mgnify:FL=1
MIKLTSREKTLLQVMAVFIGITFLYFVIISPLIKYKQSSSNSMRKNVNSLSHFDNSHEQYKQIKQEKTFYLNLLNRKNENITSLIEQWANSTNISRNIAYTRRTQTNLQNKYIRITTDIKIDGVAIEPFLKFLYEVENSNNLLRISYLRMQQAIKGSNTYDVTLKIDSYTVQ